MIQPFYLIQLISIITLWGNSIFGCSTYSSLNDTVPNNLTLIRESIYKNIPDSFKIDQYPRKSYRYADISAIELNELVTNGLVYRDLQEIEIYLNQVLQKVMPPELIADKNLHAYLLKSGYYNASMSPAGLMFVNVGLLSELDDEATLAGIFAHELAHYYLNHSIKGFVKSIEGDFKTGPFFRKKNLYSKFSIQSELDADSLAYIWLSNTDYNIAGLQKAFEIGRRKEDQELAQHKDIWELEETTHPSSEKRILQLSDFANSKNQNSGEDFVVSQDKFYALRSKARSESLKYLLRGFDYLKCIEQAFVYHIYDLENKDYIYYLMESIRRAGYLDSRFWGKNFITFTYLKEIITEKDKKKIRMNAHIFEEFPDRILGLPSDAEENIAGKFYWDGEPKFITNEQAFVFFSSVAELYKINECLLSDALSVFFKKDLLEKKLVKYSANENIDYREFATAILKNGINPNFPNRKLTIVNNLIAGVRHGREMIPITSKGREDDEFLELLIQDVASNFKNREFIFLSEIQNSNPDRFELLQELEEFSFSSLLASGNKSELILLDPRYWKLLDELEVSEIEFVNCRYIDTRKREYGLESYIKSSSTSISELISDVKRHRYFQLIISSVRVEKDKKMKTFYISSEEKLGYKNDVRQEIVDFITRKLSNREERLKEFDQKN